MFKQSSQLTRSLVVIAGTRTDNIQFVSDLVQGSEHDALLVTASIDVTCQFPVVTYKQASGLLGQEKKVVVVDVNDDLHPDSLAIVAGLVIGGGCLILSAPPREQWDSIFASKFSKRFIQFLSESQFAHFITPDDKAGFQQVFESIKQLRLNPELKLTTDQENVIKEITALIDLEDKQALVVISDRGRGKSTSLGIAAAQLIKSGTKKILITAPRFKACEVAFDHAKKHLAETRYKQATIQHEQSEFKFMAPDEILAGQYDADILFIDEAASIPVPILKQLLQRFEKTIFVSTVHGYEGTGRGFSVRFSKVLHRLVPGWKQIEMKQPVRWSADDELEPWLFKWLCLDADVVDLGPGVSFEQVKIRQITQDDLVCNESLLREVFALLVLAHYKTRPSDLKRLLDDDIIITIAELDTVNGKQVVGVILSANEGGFGEKISSAIYRGERRPQGHLLAQTLTYHCGVERAGCATSHRVMRIVVHPQCQNSGIGIGLISHLTNYLKQAGVDLLGASFGLTKELANFWQQNQFELVRVGLTKEQSSGERAAVYVQALTEAGLEIVKEARNRFSNHFPQLHETILHDVDKNIIDIPPVKEADELSQSELEDIESFVNYSRSYELCIGGVNKWLAMQLPVLKAEKNNQYIAVIENVLLHKMDWKSLAKHMSLAGKKQAQALFKQAVIHLWNKAQ